MAVFYTVNGLAVDSGHFGKARLTQIVFGSQCEQAPGQLGTHVLDIAFEHRLARLGNRLRGGIYFSFGSRFCHAIDSTNEQIAKCCREHKSHQKSCSLLLVGWVYAHRGVDWRR